MTTAHGGCRISPPPCPRACWAMCAGNASSICARRRAARPPNWLRCGAEVIAVEREPARMARLKENLARLKLEGRTASKPICATMRRGTARALRAARCALQRHRHDPPPSRTALDQERRRRDAVRRRGGRIARCGRRDGGRRRHARLRRVFAGAGGGTGTDRRFPCARRGDFARVPVTADDVFGLARTDHSGRRSAHPALSPGRTGRHGRLLCRAAFTTAQDRAGPAHRRWPDRSCRCRR